MLHYITIPVNAVQKESRHLASDSPMDMTLAIGKARETERIPEHVKIVLKHKRKTVPAEQPPARRKRSAPSVEPSMGRRTRAIMRERNRGCRRRRRTSEYIAAAIRRYPKRQITSGRTVLVQSASIRVNTRAAKQPAPKRPSAGFAIASTER